MSQNEISAAIKARTLDMQRLKPVMQVGWVAKGLVYGLIGIIAIPIALNGGGGSSSDDTASREGALAEIAEASYGPVLLVVVAIGLFLYAAWRLTTALLPGDNSEAETWAHRIGWGGSAILYGFLAWSALSFVISDSGGSGGGSSSGGSGSGGGGSGSGGGSTLEKVSRTLLESTGGRWLLGIGAIGGLAVAGYFADKGIERKYLEEVNMASATEPERTILRNFGMIGWIGRATTVGLLSILVLSSAITADPSDAKGLDEALRSVAGNWWGVILVLVAGVGLLAYGVHAATSARHRRLLGP